MRCAACGMHGTLLAGCWISAAKRMCCATHGLNVECTVPREERYGMSKKTLIVIDMVRDFIEPDGRLYIGPTAKRVVEAISREIDKARSCAWPVIYLCDTHSEDDSEFEMFPSHCVIGNPGAEIVDELKPHPGDKIIPKRRYSGFFQTDLDLTLRELGIDEIVLVGVCTNICNLYTAADARMLNYKVTALRDCMSSFDEAAHEFALKEMEQTLGVNVV